MLGWMRRTSTRAPPQQRPPILASVSADKRRTLPCALLTTTGCLQASSLFAGERVSTKQWRGSPSTTSAIVYGRTRQSKQSRLKLRLGRCLTSTAAPTRCAHFSRTSFASRQYRATRRPWHLTCHLLLRPARGAKRSSHTESCRVCRHRSQVSSKKMRPPPSDRTNIQRLRGSLQQCLKGSQSLCDPPVMRAQLPPAMMSSTCPPTTNLASLRLRQQNGHWYGVARQTGSHAPT